MSTATQLIYTNGNVAIDTTNNQLTFNDSTGSEYGHVNGTELIFSRDGNYTFLQQDAHYTYIYDSIGNNTLTTYYDGLAPINSTILLSRSGYSNVLNQTKNETYLYDSDSSSVLHAHWESTNANNTLTLSRGAHNNILTQDATTTALSNSAGTAILTATTSAQTLLASSLTLSDTPSTTTKTDVAYVYVEGTDGKLKKVSLSTFLNW